MVNIVLGLCSISCLHCIFTSAYRKIINLIFLQFTSLWYINVYLFSKFVFPLAGRDYLILWFWKKRSFFDWLVLTYLEATRYFLIQFSSIPSWRHGNFWRDRTPLVSVQCAEYCMIELWKFQRICNFYCWMCFKN